MPTTKSAAKRMKTSEEKRVRNRAVKSEISSTRRNLYELIAGGDGTESNRVYRGYCSLLDKAVKKGVIQANNASRRKARAFAHLNRELSTAG
ncbi:30S ribosomal protein S20 [Verrucomicrobiota bacterium]